METLPHRNGFAPVTADDLVHRAAERDQAAAERDARACAIAARLRADPAAYTALEVASLAAADRRAAAADRAAAAEDRRALMRLLAHAPTGHERDLDADLDAVGLTRRERQVLERLAQAMSTKAIAADLYLSPNSVKTHTQSVFRKIEVSSRAEAALWARDHGFGPP